MEVFMGKLFVCQICGHIEFGAAPDHCPVCHAPKDKFKEDAAAVNPAEKEGKEKHVPVILVTKECGLVPDVCRDIHIKVGATPHPMVEDHFIQWIDVYVNKKYAARYYLTPALQAAVSVHLKSDAQGTIQAVEFCNKHGRWMAEAAL
jgi:superoxide reductase